MAVLLLLGFPKEEISDFHSNHFTERANANRPRDPWRRTRHYNSPSGNDARVLVRVRFVGRGWRRHRR